MTVLRMILATIALVWALPAAAQPVSVESLRAQAMAGDAAAVETSLARHQAAFVAGEIDSDQARVPYTLFDTTHPRIIAFTDDWLAASPASPYALTARAWVLNRMGWLVRGEKSGRETHPQAAAEHRAMHVQANKLALEAYGRMPDLLAASDTVITLTHTGGTSERAVEVLFEVMEARPNYETLSTGFTLTHTGYGGTADWGFYLCEELAPLIEDESVDMARYCMMDWITRWRPFEGWPALLDELLAHGEVPDGDFFRYRLAMKKLPVTEASAKLIHDYMSRDDYVDVAKARFFDHHIGSLFGYELMEYVVLDRAKIAAMKALKHDPLNPALLDLLERGSMDTKRIEQGHSLTPRPDGLHIDDRIEHAKRRLLVAPYDGDHWVALANLMRKQQRIKGRTGYDLFATDPYYENAVVYGQHGFMPLHTLLSAKGQQLIAYDAAVAEKWENHGWDQMRLIVDRDDDLLCPLIRVDRLLLRAASQTRAARLEVDPATGAAMEAHYADARSRDACVHARAADIESLQFEARDVSVQSDYGAVSSRLN